MISSAYNNKNKNDKKVYIFMVFESLDFLYVPSLNIQDSIIYYTKVLDGKLLWKIHEYGVWVAFQSYQILKNYISYLPTI